MGKYDHTTLYIPDRDRANLERIARELGYVQTRGAGAGKLGSISALVCAIARREVALVPANRQNGANDTRRSERVTEEVDRQTRRRREEGRSGTLSAD
jgi:hypothetical protein